MEDNLGNHCYAQLAPREGCRPRRGSANHLAPTYKSHQVQLQHFRMLAKSIDHRLDHSGADPHVAEPLMSHGAVMVPP